jgi:serine protease Do
VVARRIHTGLLVPGLLLICPPAVGLDQRPPAEMSYEALQATQEVFHGVVEKVVPYLVRIETVGGSQPTAPLPEDETEEEQPRERRQHQFQDSLGSDFVVADGPTTGLVYSPDGYIITSSFNFVREPILISAVLPDGRRMAADLVARDQVRKIALLKVEAQGLPTPRWASVDDVRVGQWAIALGFGLGEKEPSISVGIISALNRMSGNAIQTDAKLSPANYGGPLCDSAGRIIGLCTPMAQRHGELAGAEMYDSGVGFALYKERIDNIVSALRQGKSFHRGWLGISVDTRFMEGVIVANVAVPSPMHSADVKVGDRLVSANGRPLRHYGDLMRALYMLPAGEKVDLVIDRGGKEWQASVKLARSDELGSLPEVAEPFDPSLPAPEEEPPVP